MKQINEILKERNASIDRDFSTLYKESKAQGATRLHEIYFTLHVKYNLSIMQIRRIIKGY